MKWTFDYVLQRSGEKKKGKSTRKGVDYFEPITMTVFGTKVLVLVKVAGKLKKKKKKNATVKS